MSTVSGRPSGLIRIGPNRHEIGLQSTTPGVLILWTYDCIAERGVESVAAARHEDAVEDARAHLRTTAIEGRTADE